MHQEALSEAVAIAARTGQTLEAAGITAAVQAVWHRACPSRGAHQGRAIAVAHAAHRAGVAVVVTAAQLPVPTVEHGPEVVLVAQGSRTPFTVHRRARSRGLAQL